VGLEVLERLLYPVVPVLVTAEHGGRVGGMLAAWWMQASFNPPLLAVAIAPERYTYKLVRESGVFAFNLLDFRDAPRRPTWATYLRGSSPGSWGGPGSP